MGLLSRKLAQKANQEFAAPRATDTRLTIDEIATALERLAQRGNDAHLAKHEAEMDRLRSGNRMQRWAGKDRPPPPSDYFYFRESDQMMWVGYRFSVAHALKGNYKPRPSHWLARVELEQDGSDSSTRRVTVSLYRFTVDDNGKIQNAELYETFLNGLRGELQASAATELASGNPFAVDVDPALSQSSEGTSGGSITDERTRVDESPKSAVNPFKIETLETPDIETDALPEKRNPFTRQCESFDARKARH